MTGNATRPRLGTTRSPDLNLDGLTDGQLEVVNKFASVLRALSTSDAERELDDFWTAWSRLIPAIPSAEVEHILTEAVSLARSHVKQNPTGE